MIKISTFSLMLADGRNTQTSVEDSLEIVRLNELGFELGNTNLDSALLILKQAHKLSNTINNPHLIALSEYNLGSILNYKGNLDSASYFTLSALQFFEKSQDTARVFNSYRKMGQIYQQLNRFDESLFYYSKVGELAKELGDDKSIGTSLNDIASFYMHKGWTYNDSISHFFHKAEGLILKAVKHFLKADYERGVALCYGNLGGLFTDLGENEKAIAYSKKGLDYFGKLGLDIYTVISYNQLAKIYVNIQKYDSAILFAEKSFALADRLDSQIDRRNACAWLSSAHEGLGNYKLALKYQREYHNYQFAIISEENNATIANLDKKYQTEKKEAENELLKKDNLLQSSTIKTQETLIIVAIVVILTLIIVAFFIFRAYKIRRRLIKRIEKQKNKIESDKHTIEIQKSKLEALDKAKSRFFANISHDLRSPLTMMLGNIESIIEDEDSYLTHKSESNLLAGFNNAKRIVQLSDEITDLSILEDGKIHLNLQFVKIVSYLQLLVEMFRSATEQKKIQLDFISKSGEDFIVKIDPQQFEKIIYNLLSNAIKFTEAGGIITVSVFDTHDDALQIEVKDDGTGIPENSLPFIFDRYYQSAENKYNPREGLGIGLSLVKELVDLHQGEISVKSTSGFGTTFSLVLPKQSITDSSEVILPEISDYTKQKTSLDKALVNGSKKNSPIGQLSFNKNGQSKNLILIVEDHPEIKKYINDIIASNHQTILANNGKEALEILTKTSVDLVVTDLMMPWMDGFELIEAMKEDQNLRKIPIMVLSARTGEADRNSILNKGVNEFLSKPFNKKELLLRIQNLLKQKENWSHNSNISIVNDLKPESEIEKGILQKLENYIISRISDANLSVTDLGHEMAASERQIYRMVKNVANITPLELIKEVRYQYVHELFLQKKIKNFSEGAEAIGMKNASHFKEEYLNRYENSSV